MPTEIWHRHPRPMARINVFISHSFEHLDKYSRIVEFLEQEGLPTANYSVPVWGQLTGTVEERAAGLQERVRSCNVLLVLLTPEIHKSGYITLEIETAKQYSKPIIGIFPHGQNEGPIPQVLEGHLTHAIGWRAGSLRRAIEGEYPVERRVFDIAEVRERVDLAMLVAGAVAVVSVFVAGWSLLHYHSLCEELRERDVVVVDEADASDLVVGGLIGASAVAATVAVLGGKPKDILLGAALGALGGVGVAAIRRVRIRVVQLGGLTRAEFHPE